MPEVTQRDDVPIVGQPVRAAGFSLTVMVVCLCESPQPLVLSLVNSLAAPNGERRSAIVCPSCGRQWSLGAGTKVNVDLALNLNRPITSQN